MTNEQIEELLIEIHRTQLLSMEEESELLEKIQAEGADCEELEKLVNANLRFAVSLARQYMNRGLDIRELIPIGAEGLKEAALTYDLNGDTKFLNHAVPVMRKYFEEAISKNNDIKRMMLVRELHMREYYNEEIDDYNTAFSFVVDFDRKRYTVGELFCDCTYSIDEVERYIVKYLMARTEHDESKLYWQMVENSQLNKETEKITKIQDE
jgi:DNA-directed RNA polymerase sigma subunit (sigma70/sigma32)